MIQQVRPGFHPTCKGGFVDWSHFPRLTFNYANPRQTEKVSLMTAAVEQTVKALVEFESALEMAKAEASEVKRRAMKDAMDWAEAARAIVIAEATELAARRVAEAKAKAEAEAGKIRETGESDLNVFEGSISRHLAKAAEAVALRLLGESK